MKKRNGWMGMTVKGEEGTVPVLTPGRDCPRFDDGARGIPAEVPDRKQTLGQLLQGN